jgi:N-acetylmuramate 1-kinase
LDARKEKISNWLKTQLPGTDFTLTPASSDASFRRYLRVNKHDGSLIVMDAPPEKEEIGAFCRIARQFHTIGLNVPDILAEEEKQGFVLMTDLGTRQYLDLLDASNAGRLYGDALEALVTLQAGTDRLPEFLPSYSHKLLTNEMDLFREWYLPRLLQHETTTEENAIMDRAWAILAESALQQPQVWVHRDYHSRNLMLTEHYNPGVLDFQDAVTGPITYDLVSLLKDCYIEWPAAQVETWVLNFHAQLLQEGLLKNDDEEQFLRWFHRMGIQRHLKVAGIFARLYYRDGKDGYLNDIPLTMRYLSLALKNDPDLSELSDFVSGLPCTQ